MLWSRLGWDPAFVGLGGAPRPRYRKVAAIAELLAASAKLGGDNSAAALLTVVDVFAQTGPGSWLKVAGGAKADVLTTALDGVSSALHTCVAAEFGAFVGYTTLRLADRLRRSSQKARLQQVALASVEGDPVHAAVARCTVDLARASEFAELWIGQVRDALPLITERFGQHSCAFAFFDQSGTTFHADAALLESLGGLMRKARTVADNVLRPGAPVFLTRLHTNVLHRAVAWSLPEFLEEAEGVEDWMVETFCHMKLRKASSQLNI